MNPSAEGRPSLAISSESLALQSRRPLHFKHLVLKQVSEVNGRTHMVLSTRFPLLQVELLSSED